MLKERSVEKLYEAPSTVLQDMKTEGMLCVSFGHSGYDPDEVEFDFGWK